MVLLWTELRKLEHYRLAPELPQWNSVAFFDKRRAFFPHFPPMAPEVK